MLGVRCLEDMLVEVPRSSELWREVGPGHRALMLGREGRGGRHGRGRASGCGGAPRTNPQGSSRARGWENKHMAEQRAGHGARCVMLLSLYLSLFPHWFR